MGEFVDLKAMPYYLSDEDVAWVEQTIAGMSDEEKIGQLFISHNRGLDVDEAQEQISRYHYGGQRYKDSGSYSREVFDFITGLRQVANAGVHGKPVELKINEKWIDNIRISMGLVNAVTGEMLLKMIAEGKLPAGKLATHHFTLDQMMEAYDVFGAAATTKALKVVITAE